MSITIDDDYRESFRSYKPETLEKRMKSLKNKPDEFEDKDIEELLSEFAVALERGDIRSAEKKDGEWKANAWVKQGILTIFSKAENVERKEGRSFYDVMPTRDVSEFAEKGARNTPGTTIRMGNYFGNGATVMSEAYVNIGVYIGEGTMIDSNVTTGSCAQ